MQLWAQPRTHQGDQRICSQNQDNGDQQQQGTDAGVQRREDVGPLLPRPTAQNTDHGAVKGAVDPPQKDQQKPGQHIGVVVSVIGRSNAEGSRNHELATKPTHLAQQGSKRHHQ